MKQHFASAGLQRLCGLFGKTRQAYYDHGWRSSDDRLEEELIVELVKAQRVYLPKVGGVKLLFLLQADFKLHGIKIGRGSFFELLRRHGLLIKRRRRYVQTTNSNHSYKKWPDLTKSFTLKAAEQLWVSDITYLRTASGFVYLSLITDCYTKRIVGYHVSQHLKAQGCIIALNKALKGLSEPNKLIHHSDRGIQYCCNPYVSILEQANIRISMTQTGSPYDNSVAERVNGILKHEWSLKKVFGSYNAAVAEVHTAVDRYNRLRPHMSCGNLTPQQAHETKAILIKKWKSKTYCKAKSVTL